MKTLGVDCAQVILYPFVGIVPGSFESLAEVVRSGQFENVYIVSRASLITRTYFLFRLSRSGFWEKTGIPRKNIRFCLKNREKVGICKQLGVTHFIDDRPQVLAPMQDLERRFAFNPKPREEKKYSAVLAGSTIVRSWKELKPLLLLIA
jgi:hypothetical protein